MNNDFLIYSPTVFTVGTNYQIVFLTEKNGMGWVTVNDRKFCDSTNGVVRTADTVHRVTVPQKLLDEAGEYKVGFSHFEERLPYFPKSEPHETAVFPFRAPDMSDGIQLYMLADTHSHATAPARTGSHFGDSLDLLIMNGDIGNSAKDEQNMMTIHRLASYVTGGGRPVVFARGNHDTRGAAAELLPHYVGNDNGNTYFTFRSGGVWGIVLDCGEDKDDSHPEYGEIADYRGFREAQTEFLKNIIKHRRSEYEAPGVTLKIAVCHIPFTQIVHDFADDIYDKWTRLLNRIQIDVMLTGHRHKIIYTPAGVGKATKAVPEFPVIVGSKMCDNPLAADCHDDPHQFTGTALELNGGCLTAEFTNSEGETVSKETVKQTVINGDKN